MLVTALRFRAKLLGYPSPVGAAATRVLAGFRRLAHGRGRGKVTGVRWEQADRAAAMAEQPGNMAGLRDAAIIAVASDALLRVSEVGALDVSDVNLAEQTVLIRHSKTDQESKGTVQFLGKPTTKRIQAWLLNSGLAEGALFRAVNWTGGVQGTRLTDRSIQVIIRQRAKAAGVKGRVSLAVTACGWAARRAWQTPAHPWSRCRSPGAGVHRPCRGVTRKGNWQSREPWQGSRYGDEFDLVQRRVKRTRGRSKVNS